MLPLKKALDSSIGRKFVMSLSGIALVLFVIVHLLGNLPLYFSDGEAFTAYATFLHSWGWLLTVAEVGLAATFIIHITWAFRVTLSNRQARAKKYAGGIKTKGDPSHLNPLSRNMFITGAVVLVFLVVHLWNFRVGMLVRGQGTEDLYPLVVTTFSDPLLVGFYTVAMLFFGAHLSHGLWSAAQSLGAMKPQWSKPIYATAFLIAVALAVGFLFIPIWIYINQLGA